MVVKTTEKEMILNITYVVKYRWKITCNANTIVFKFAASFTDAT